MTFDDRARLIWHTLEDRLDDRGCFNGVDYETMEEIRTLMVKLIIDKLGNQ